MDKIKFAVIGLGNIGKRHLAVIDADERAEITDICDVLQDRCEHYANLYDIPNWTQDFQKLLETTEADVISICTPHASHAELSIATANAGKHIMVEKPMALNVADCNRMIEAANKNNVKLIVVKQNRYNKPVVITKAAIDEGMLGRVFMVECNVLWNRHDGYYTDSDWRGNIETEGGALFTQVSHFIDLLIWWFGDVVDAKTIIDTQMHNIEIEDIGTSIVNFSSGTVGTINWTTNVYNKNYEGSITIVGEKGTIKIGGPYLNKIEFWDVMSFPLPENVRFDDRPNSYGKYQGTSSNHDKVIDNLIKMLRKDKHHIVEGLEGLKSVEAIEMIYKGA